jgi:hypothetical protein
MQIFEGSVDIETINFKGQKYLKNNKNLEKDSKTYYYSK